VLPRVYRPAVLRVDYFTNENELVRMTLRRFSTWVVLARAAGFWLCAIPIPIALRKAKITITTTKCGLLYTVVCCSACVCVVWRARSSIVASRWGVASYYDYELHKKRCGVYLTTVCAARTWLPWTRPARAP